MMTTQNILKIVKVVIVIQMIAINAHAAGTCLLDKSDIREDTKIINEKLTVVYGFSPVTDSLKRLDSNSGFYSIHSSYPNDQYRRAIDATQKIYDDQELKVDRSLPFLNQVNAVGVVTVGSAEDPESYGTAVLISPCHVLINAHAIKDEKTKNGESPILISLGQSSCNSKDAFAHQDIKGQVIASGNAEDPASDYAIVRIPRIYNIDPALISTEYLNIGESLMTVGFPYKATLSQKTGFRYPTANFSRANGINPGGTFRILNRTDSAGGSGSGVFILDEDNGRPQLVLTGIHRSQEGIGLQTPAVLNLLKANNKALYNQLAKAIKTKSCE